MPGSQDHHPPMIIGPADYDFVAIAEPDGHFRIHKNSRRRNNLGGTEVARRLRFMADTVETTPEETA